MGLENAQTCIDVYVDLAKAQLEIEKVEEQQKEEQRKAEIAQGTPPSSEELPDEDTLLKKNFSIFGEAFYKIAIAHTEVISSQDGDEADFWKWVNDVDGWLKELKAWQIGMNKAFQDWQPTQPTEKQLQEKLKQLPALKDPPKKPTLLKGKIQ